MFYKLRTSTFPWWAGYFLKNVRFNVQVHQKMYLSCDSNKNVFSVNDRFLEKSSCMLIIKRSESQTMRCEQVIQRIWTTSSVNTININNFLFFNVFFSVKMYMNNITTKKHSTKHSKTSKTLSQRVAITTEQRVIQTLWKCLWNVFKHGYETFILRY